MSNSDIFREDLNRLEKELKFDDALWCWSFDVDTCKYSFIIKRLDVLEMWRAYISKAEIEKDEPSTIDGLAERIIKGVYYDSCVYAYCQSCIDCESCIINDKCDAYTGKPIEWSYAFIEELANKIKTEQSKKEGDDIV